MIAQTIGGLAIAVVNIGFWWLAMTRWQQAFRRRCERRYNVTIDLAYKGFWNVREDVGWWKRWKIECLQFAFIMGLFVVWGVGVLLVVLALGFLQK